jgi:hypothetical protein
MARLFVGQDIDEQILMKSDRREKLLDVLWTQKILV